MASEQQELKLLGGVKRMSPFVARVMISLRLKGINYEYVQQDLQNKSQLLLQSNPVHKKVPVLLHNGKAICESLVILEYIEETWPSSPHPLLPSDPYDRAVARFWAAFIDGKLAESLRKIIKAPNKEAQAEAVEEAKTNLAFLEEALKRLGKGKTYFGGETLGLVDVMLGSLYAGIKAFETLAEVSVIDKESVPALSALLDILTDNEQLKELLPDPVKVTEFLRRVLHSPPQS